MRWIGSVEAAFALRIEYLRENIVGESFKNSKMIKQKERVVITGLAPLASIGLGKTELWESILAADTGLFHKDYFIEGTKIDTFYTHEIKNFNIRNFGIEEAFLNDIESWKQEKEWTDLSFLLAATKLAIDDSHLSGDLDKDKTGLILTHENPGLDQFYAGIFKEMLDVSKQSKDFRSFFKQFGKNAYDLQTFMFLYHVARTFDIHGYSLFVNNACASGLYALEAGADVIRSNKCDVMIIAAADCVSIYKYLWFKELGMYPEDGLTKPFAKNRNGFVLGDGAAGIVLESLESALKRKAHVYAEYLGGGFSLEGWKVAIPNITSDAYEKAIEDALKKAHLGKESIDLIVPHGVGTSITDAYEAKAITEIFGKDFKRPFLTALKPYIGHTLGSTALLETTILLLALENGIIPATLNSQELDPKLHVTPARKQIKINLKTVMKTACGFAGYNAAAIFRKLGNA